LANSEGRKLKKKEEGFWNNNKLLVELGLSPPYFSFFNRAVSEWKQNRFQYLNMVEKL